MRGHEGSAGAAAPTRRADGVTPVPGDYTIKRGRFVLLPATDSTHGHGMHSWAAFWQGELRKLLGTPAR